MVRKTIRIYKFHDVDLFYLAEHYNFNFQKALYCAIREYLKKEVRVITLPEKREVPIHIPKKSISRVLSLDESKDQDILEFIKKLPKGYVNGILKNILRIYLCRPIMEPWTQEYNKIFLAGKITMDAAGYKKTNATKNKEQKIKITKKTTEPVPLHPTYKSIEEEEDKNIEKSVSLQEKYDDEFLTDAFSAFFD